MVDANAAAIVDKDATLAAFVEHFASRFGAHLLAVLAYGSYLRGKRDTVLDFYVVLDSYSALPRLAGLANRLLPPNVYHVTLGSGDARQAAKFATVTLEHFKHSIETDFHCYFWARFAQPFVVLFARDESLRRQIEQLGLAAARRVLASSLAALPETFDSETAWRHAFTLSYGAELRAEDAAGAARLVEHYGETLNAHLEALASEFNLTPVAPRRWRHTPSALAATRLDHEWKRRRRLGKFLSIARLLKAAFTFNDPLDYVVWKVARHSGVVEEPTPLQRRHPLLFGWGVLWRLYRRGGFR
ncbi:MAG: hypothetical protein IT492_16460 [Gammaproteobacteria bacterium]|nr:hypothetical protein [Gammaproteobacteria bacterium]